MKVPAAMKMVSPLCAALIAAWIDMPARTWKPSANCSTSTPESESVPSGPEIVPDATPPAAEMPDVL